MKYICFENNKNIDSFYDSSNPLSEGCPDKTTRISSFKDDQCYNILSFKDPTEDDDGTFKCPSKKIKIYLGDKIICSYPPLPPSSGPGVPKPTTEPPPTPAPTPTKKPAPTVAPVTTPPLPVLSNELIPGINNIFVIIGGIIIVIIIISLKKKSK